MIKLFVGADRNFPMRGVNLYLFGKDVDGSLSVAAPIAYEVLQDYQLAEQTSPTLTISMEAAQQLLDDLYNVGLRPTHAIETGSTLAAQKAHIDDLRTILFAVLDNGEDTHDRPA